MTRRWAMVAAVALVAGGAWAQERLAAVGPGESVSGTITVADSFPTGEWLWQAAVTLEGEGALTLCYPARGRTALRVIEAPTDGPTEVSLRLRANPVAMGHDLMPLRIEWTLQAGQSEVSARVSDVRLTPLYQHEIPRVVEPPVIDGDLSDACWDDAAYIGDPYWRMFNRPRDARMATHVWCAYDDDNLYVAFRCETPDVERLVRRIKRRDGFVWRDDSAEIFFNWGHDHDSYYEYVINPDDVVFDGKWFPGGLWLTDWNYLGEWKSSSAPGAWNVEIRLALESYEERDLQGNPTGFMPLPTGDIAGILFSRNDMVLGEGMSHADNAPSFHEVEQYGHLVGFRPNRIEAYRRTALREIGELETQWEGVTALFTKPELALLGQGGDFASGLAGLRRQIEAPAPSFDDWVSVRSRLAARRQQLAGYRSAVALVVAQRRWRDAPWGLALTMADGGRYQVPAVFRLAAARGGTAAVRLEVLPRAGQSSVRAVPEPLTGAGASLDAIRWYAVVPGGAFAIGDRLAPEQPVSSGGLWWEVEVPRDAEPGVYQGEIVTTDGTHRVALPVELTVHDFALPEEPSLAVAVGLDAEEVARLWYGERAPLGPGEYWLFAEMLLRHRVMPRELLADLTRWGDGDALSFAPADRMLARARPLGLRVDALTAARPEVLAGLSDPRRALARAIEHWKEAEGVEPIPLYAPAGVTVPDRLRDADLRRSIAGIPRELPLPPAAEALGTWALAPEIAVGLGDYKGAPVRAAADEAGKDRGWCLAPSDSSRTALLGWIAHRYGVGRVFLDDGDRPGRGGRAAGGLVYCLAGPGEDAPRLREPQPSVRLKLLRAAIEDYERLAMLAQLDAMLGRHQVGDRLWRLRQANYTQLRRNWDLVLNVWAYNGDPEHLAARRAEVARQIERSRRWLRSAGEADLPGDVEEAEA